MASQTCESPPLSPCDFVDHAPEEDKEHTTYPPPDAIRMVGIRKVAGEHLVGCNKILRVFIFYIFVVMAVVTRTVVVLCHSIGNIGFLTDSQ